MAAKRTGYNLKECIRLYSPKETTDVSKRWKEASTVFAFHDEAVRATTVRPRYPFVALGVPLVLLLLFAFGPTVILLTGGMVAGALGLGYAD